MKKITSAFRVNSAKRFVENFSNSVYFVGAHKSIPFTNDSIPDAILETEDQTYYSPYRNLIFGKHVTPSDIKLGIKNIPWTEGTVYDIYDDSKELENLNFYVVSEESGSFHVFKCLYNNGDASTDQPLFSETDPADEIYRTNDGYVWKYMYSIDAATYTKFSTENFIPVVLNQDVIDNATNGSIDAIILDNPGVNYNSYASGHIKQTGYNGDSKAVLLEGNRYTDYKLAISNATDFIEGRVTSLNADGKIASGVIVSIYGANNTHVFLDVTNVAGAFTVGRDLVLESNTSITTPIDFVELQSSALSSNNNFYNNSSFYIRSGPGAGQVRVIDDYVVSGSDRLAILNEEFDVFPDSTSVFEISPRVIINGDGQGAVAISGVDPATTGIHNIEIINPGSNYTYANIEIIGNTGFSSNSVGTSTAKVHAIIAPPGGHGSDPYNELFAYNTIIGTSFANTETGSIPTENGFRMISLLKNPEMANVELHFSTVVGFAQGETVVQANTGATGKIFNISSDKIQLTEVSGYFLTGNSTVNTVKGSTSNYTGELIGFDTKNYQTIDQRQTFNVTVQNGPTGLAFIVGETVVQNNSSDKILKLRIDGNSYAFLEGETITQPDTGASGKISDRTANTLTILNYSGTFQTGNTSINEIYGQTSNTTVAVSYVDKTFGSQGIAAIHQANSSVISLTEVRGTFSTSGINTFTGLTSGAIATITSRVYDKNYFVNGSGEFVYLENFSPVDRNSSQTEKIKIVVEF